MTNKSEDHGTADQLPTGTTDHRQYTFWQSSKIAITAVAAEAVQEIAGAFYETTRDRFPSIEKSGLTIIMRAGESGPRATVRTAEPQLREAIVKMLTSQGGWIVRVEDDHLVVLMQDL